MSPIATLTRGIDALSRLFGYLAALITIVLIGVTLFEVFSRYALHAPTVWAFDVAYMMNGALVLLGSAMALKVNQHVTIDILSTTFTYRQKQVIEVLTFGLLMLPALGFITYTSWIEFWKAYVNGTLEHVSPWRPVLWPFRLVIAVGLTALWLQVLARVLQPRPPE